MRGKARGLTEQGVDVFLGNLGKRRIERESHLALAVNLAVNGVKDVAFTPNAIATDTTASFSSFARDAVASADS